MSDDTNRVVEALGGVAAAFDRAASELATIAATRVPPASPLTIHTDLMPPLMPGFNYPFYFNPTNSGPCQMQFKFYAQDSRRLICEIRINGGELLGVFTIERTNNDG